MKRAYKMKLDFSTVNRDIKITNNKVVCDSVIELAENIIENGVTQDSFTDLNDIGKKTIPTKEILE